MSDYKITVNKIINFHLNALLLNSLSINDYWLVLIVASLKIRILFEDDINKLSGEKTNYNYSKQYIQDITRTNFFLECRAYTYYCRSDDGPMSISEYHGSCYRNK